MAEPCPACAAPPRGRIREASNYKLWKCSECGLLYHSRPKEEATEDLYEADYFGGRKKWGVGYADYQESGQWEASRIWEVLGPELALQVPAKGRLLDVGCASGFFVEKASQDGWEGVGIDVSEFATEQGRKRGLDLRATTIQNAGFPSEHFDAVICLQTLEHLPDPRSALEELHRITTPRGVIAIDVPSSDSLGYKINREKWAQVKPPEHLQYFGKRSLHRLLSTTGWTVVLSESLYYPASALVHYELLGGVRSKIMKAAIRIMDRTGLIQVLKKTGLGTFLRVLARRT